jgi:thioredoxin-related protein
MQRIFFILFLLYAQIGFSQIKWYRIEDAQAAAARENKKIMVKVYAKWCGWCKEMDKSTFPNKGVTKVLSENFINVKFDSEQKGDIVWNNQNYKLIRRKKGGPYHELAATWLNGKLSFPTIVFIDENGKVIQAITGYRKSAEMEKIAAYFATNSYKSINWSDFEKKYKQ